MSETINKYSNTLSGYKIGFIGLGLMGKPMCLNLQKAGAELVIHNRSQAVVHELSQIENISSAKTPAEVASQCNLIIIMVSDTKALETVIFGNEGLYTGIKAGSLVIDMGTTAVTPTRDFARRLKTRGADYIDAPVSGGELGAINGSLVIMAGGTGTITANSKTGF